MCVCCELTVSTLQPTQTRTYEHLEGGQSVVLLIDIKKEEKLHRGHLCACMSVNVCTRKSQSQRGEMVGMSTIKPVYAQTTARSKKIESIHLLIPYLISSSSHFYSINIPLSHTWFGFKAERFLRGRIYITMADGEGKINRASCIKTHCSNTMLSTDTYTILPFHLLLLISPTSFETRKFTCQNLLLVIWVL